jgi:hypothetical protein
MLAGEIRPMLCWISIFGGLLIMMGHHARSEALFYYFRLEDQVPEHHLLRLISAWTDLVQDRGNATEFLSSFLGGESLWCCRWA